MNQSENTLPHEHQDLSADPQHQCKKLGTAHISNPAPWDMNRQTPAHWPASNPSQIHMLQDRRPCLDLHKHTHINMYIQYTPIN